MSLGLLRLWVEMWAAQWSYLLRLIGPCDDVHSHNLDVWQVWRRFHMNVLWESDEVMSLYTQKVKGRLHCDVIMSCDRFWRFWRFWRLLTTTADAGYSWLWMTSCPLIVWWAINSNIQPSVSFVFVIILFWFFELFDWLEFNIQFVQFSLYCPWTDESDNKTTKISYKRSEQKCNKWESGLKKETSWFIWTANEIN